MTTWGSLGHLEAIAARRDAEDLGHAWAEAEAALPEGWWLESLELHGTNEREVGGRIHRLTWWDALARGPKDAEQDGAGPTPAAALRALAAKLREKRP